MAPHPGPCSPAHTKYCGGCCTCSLVGYAAVCLSLPMRRSEGSPSTTMLTSGPTQPAVIRPEGQALCSTSWQGWLSGGDPPQPKAGVSFSLSDSVGMASWSNLEPLKDIRKQRWCLCNLQSLAAWIFRTTGPHHSYQVYGRSVSSDP